MILIKNARVMDPESGFDQVTDILLDGKKIRQIGKVNDVSGIEQVINASGMIAAPGLIDVHVHFRDPGFTYKEDLQTGSAAAAAGAVPCYGAAALCLHHAGLRHERPGVQKRQAHPAQQHLRKACPPWPQLH